ncbi:hypothetical protein [Paenibacillus odorifer]|uniref:hypothetical protein n=1 Tax=Paenibacillus odorifer TaxID=189426 RepID=UPI00096F8185|nr:hypothetical protein [Paenibacillus odorifer]OME23426.1 hypothetical protein BSK57_16585 [Paenibacillus odorifer]
MSEINYKQLTTERLNIILEDLNKKAKDGNRLSILIYTNFGHIEANECVDIFEGKGLDHDNPVQGILYGALTSAEDECIRIQKIDPKATFSKDSFLLLKDAKITTYGSNVVQHVVSDMILFCDQIVGLSFR